METTSNDLIRVGIDIGGTFTDFVIFYPSTHEIKTLKTLSTTNNPALAVIHGVELLNIPTHSNIIHGSTVATNSLLERKGSKTALITTKGFKDILLIGRQNRPALYDWTIPNSPPIIPPELSFEINERVDSDGNILIPLTKEDIQTVTRQLVDNGVQSVAISLIFSFLHPQHERDITTRLRSENIFVSASSEIIPEYREFERTSTTAVNAYVSPVLDQYLSTLSSGITNENLQVMQSNGGMISLDKARNNGVRCILSGPAGGVIGAQHLAKIAIKSRAESTKNDAHLKIITFDMGGTSTDISLIDQTPKLTTETLIGGCPISIPVLDIHTIGAGGGSIASKDQGGALSVGPESAGADPGPACYGRGDLPTVTDANIVLGRLVPELFLGGTMPLDVDRAWKSIEKLATQLGIDLIRCALGIITVANAHMERALRVISVERGFDPREFILFSFGGAGGLHSVELARSLKIPQVLISPYASVLSAFGMLAADVVLDYVQTVMLNNSSPIGKITSSFQPLITQGNADLRSQGIESQHANVQLFIDARYQGQSYELTIPFSAKWDAEFHQNHQDTYGYQLPDVPIELVNIRVKAIGHTYHPIPSTHPKGRKNPNNAFLFHKDILSKNQKKTIPCYQHEALEPGNIIQGPALIIRPDTTVLIDEYDSIEVDIMNNLWVNIG